MFKEPKVYLATTAEPARPSIWQYRSVLFQIAGAIVVMCVGIMIGHWLVTPLLVAASTCFALYRAYQLGVKLQPPLIGVASSREERPSTSESVRLEHAAESLVEEIEPVASAGVASKADDERTLYRERAHPLRLIEDLGRILLVTLVTWGSAGFLLVLAGADRRSATTLLVSSAAVAVVVLAAGSTKWLLQGLFAWLKWPARTLLVVALVSIAALTWAVALVVITLALILTGGFIVLRTWARWYHTFYTITDKRIIISRKIPWFYFMEDSSPSTPIKKLTSLTPKQSVFEKWLGRKFWGMESGFFEADTPGQQDNIFHTMRRMRRYQEVREILEELLG